MTTTASHPRRELQNKPVPAKKNIRPIGGDTNEDFGEIDRYPQNEISPKARELTEKPVRALGMPSKGSLHFGTMPVEIGQQALDLSGKTTRVGLNLAKGLGEGFIDVFKMIKGDENKPKTPEAKAEEQKKQTAKIEYNFVRQKTTGTEQTVLNVAKSKDREALAAIMGPVNESDVKAKGHQETWRRHTANSIARERSEKIAAQKRKRYGSGIGSPAKKGGRMGGVSSSGAKSNMLTTAEDQNMNHAG